VWEYRDDGTAIRTITEFGELYDVGPVTYPAYPATRVSARALEMAAPQPAPEQPAAPPPDDVRAREIERLRLAAADRH
jgi:phage head maturation protease